LHFNKSVICVENFIKLFEEHNDNLDEYESDSDESDVDEYELDEYNKGHYYSDLFLSLPKNIKDYIIESVQKLPIDDCVANNLYCLIAR